MSVGLSQSKVKIANMTIINCNIEKLYGDVFRTNEVTKIVIEDTPIREIANDTFIEVGKYIEELHLNLNKVIIMNRNETLRFSKYNISFFNVNQAILYPQH